MKNFILIFLIFPLGLKSQIMPEDNFKKLRFIGIRISTDGYGLNYRYGWSIDIAKQRVISFDFSNVKHPKEKSLQDKVYSAPSFILGKALYMFAFRPDYGIRDRMFKKANKEGVEICWYWSVGPSFAILKPYYIQYQMPNNFQPFDPKKHDPYNLYANNQKIIGGGGFFYGMNKITIEPGLHGKLALDFEWGSIFDILNSFEIGLMVDVYAKKILIIPQAENKKIFLSLFGCYNFGKKK